MWMAVWPAATAVGYRGLRGGASRESSAPLVVEPALSAVTETAELSCHWMRTSFTYFINKILLWPHPKDIAVPLPTRKPNQKGMQPTQDKMVVVKLNENAWRQTNQKWLWPIKLKMAMAYTTGSSANLSN
jgi:hypothetical protein